MEILMLWSERPSVFSGEASAALNIIKNLGKKHRIHLVYSNNIEHHGREYEDITDFCSSINQVDIKKEESEIIRIIRLILNYFNPKNFHTQRFISSIYTFEMEKIVESILKKQTIDIIYSNCPTAPYVRNFKIPKVAHIFDCGSCAAKKNFLSGNIKNKFYWALSYFQYKWIENKVLNNFDCCIVITKDEFNALKNSNNNLTVEIISNGVDDNYFLPLKLQEDSPSLLFVGTMDHQPNVEAVLYFYSSIYGKIKREFPNIKFFIVGQNPVESIKDLSSDNSVIVTGFVDDIRNYLAKSSLALAPFISGTGLKTKVLEAMSMGKTVVSTSIGVKGIEITGKDIVIADKPNEFANIIIELLYDEQKRTQIGLNARKTTEMSYSWNGIALKIEKLFQEIVKDENS